jgi:hypothetical protein
MFDLTKSFFNDLREHPVASGASVTEEGQLLVYVADGAGGVAVQPCTTGASQRLAGFSICDAMKVITETVVETVTVPVGGGTVTLHNANIIITAGTDARAVASTTGVLTYNAGVPGGGEYGLTTAGVITFNVAEQNQTVTISYRYNLTMEQMLDKYHERSISNRGQDYFSTVAVGCLSGEIYTNQYDQGVAYVINAALFPAANGRVSSAAGGAANAVGYVIQLPSTTDGLLGIKYIMPVVS